jgi:hypothetical protein
MGRRLQGAARLYLAIALTLGLLGFLAYTHATNIIDWVLWGLTIGLFSATLVPTVIVASVIQRNYQRWRTSGYERALVIAEPSPYFILIERAAALERFGPLSRDLPPSMRAMKLLITLVVSGLTWLLAAELGLAVFTLAAGYNFLISVVVAAILAIITGIWGWRRGFWYIQPLFRIMQPLWWFKRVTDAWTWTIERDPMTQRLQYVGEPEKKPLSAPRIEALITQSMVRDAMASDRGVQEFGAQRADDLYLARRPENLRRLFRLRHNGGIGKPEVYIGAGYLVTALAIVGFVVLAQRGG